MNRFLKKGNFFFLGFILSQTSPSFAADGFFDLGGFDYFSGTSDAGHGYGKSLENKSSTLELNTGVPSGAIVPFVGKCPEGSREYTELAGRVVVGAGHLNDGTLSHIYRVGEKGGKQRHRLRVSEMPSHNHTIPTEPDGSGGWGSVRTGPHRPAGKWDSSYSGGTRFHENRMPYLVLNWCLFD